MTQYMQQKCPQQNKESRKNTDDGGKANTRRVEGYTDEWVSHAHR